MNRFRTAADYLRQGLRGLWDWFTSTGNFAPAATVAIIKTDINSFFKICGTLTICIFCVGGVFYMYYKMTKSYRQIIESVCNQNTCSRWNIATLLILSLGFVYLFRPVLIASNPLLTYLPAVAIAYIWGDKQRANQYVEAMIRASQL